MPWAPDQCGLTAVDCLRRSLLLAGIGLGIAPAAHARPQFRNSLGQPDFEGIWTSLSETRLERPPAFKGQWASPEEVKAYLAKREQGPPAEADKIGQFTSEWWERGQMTTIGGSMLSSFIVDPPDGQLPYSEEGKRVMEAKVKAMEEDTSSYEARDTFERCLYGIAGPPLGSVSIGSQFRILQTRGQVALCSEIMHDVRLIELGPRRGADMPSWTGASYGRFEGDALLVETRGFHPLLTIRVGDFYMSPQAIVRERFRRVSDREILYEWEVEDPSVYTQVWRAMLMLNRSDQPMFEYACHEGNYGLGNILAGAREEEKAQAQKSAGK
ncbi:MAG TPA: hypothetical protein VFN88_06135 [Caulobacteraceae bacterium]|nr:hypothetical protein [Caulobacteraceae bacterium]